METLVETTEAFCDAVENVSSSVIERYVADVLRLSIPATVANIRLFYYVTQKHSPSEAAWRGFEQLRYILTNDTSGWEKLNDVEKVSFLKHTRDIYNEVFVFSSNL
tara:strand:- start:774 stop:1091 length:318 start_codon:yes stop_codon:yes gene_type:complete